LIHQQISMDDFSEANPDNRFKDWITLILPYSTGVLCNGNVKSYGLRVN
jgi:hypothetical protein